MCEGVRSKGVARRCLCLCDLQRYWLHGSLQEQVDQWVLKGGGRHQKSGGVKEVGGGLCMRNI